MTICARITAHNRLRRSLLVLGAATTLLILPVSSVPVPDGGIPFMVGAGGAQALTYVRLRDQKPPTYRGARSVPQSAKRSGIYFSLQRDGRGPTLKGARPAKPGESGLRHVKVGGRAVSTGVVRTPIPRAHTGPLTVPSRTGPHSSNKPLRGTVRSHF